MPTVHIVTLKAVVPQHVHCVHCESKFIYEMTVSGIGFGNSDQCGGDTAAQMIARKAAEEHLDKQLNDRELCEAVPCPNCFRHQPYMQRVAAAELGTGWGCLAYPLIATGTFVAAISASVWALSESDTPRARTVFAVALATSLLGRGLLVLRRLRRTHYDPNSAPLADRRRAATRRTMSLAEFDSLQTERLETALTEPIAQESVQRQTRPWVNAESASESEPRIIDWW